MNLVRRWKSSPPIAKMLGHDVFGRFTVLQNKLATEQERFFHRYRSACAAFK